jgi:hypothetical protein
MIAALFVETNGAYFGIPDVDPWDVTRDARRYLGPWPVVAHPPCQLWVNFAALNFKRYGGEHNRPGNDGGCFASALSSVRRWGGVLEHPASSNAFAAHGLPRPRGIGWEEGAGGWVCEVWQSAYGHRARKRTWLYAVGPRPPELDWTRARPGTPRSDGSTASSPPCRSARRAPRRRRFATRCSTSRATRPTPSSSS